MLAQGKARTRLPSHGSWIKDAPVAMKLQEVLKKKSGGALARASARMPGLNQGEGPGKLEKSIALWRTSQRPQMAALERMVLCDHAVPTLLLSLVAGCGYPVAPQSATGLSVR